MATFTVGQTLSPGVTVATDSVVGVPGGTLETMVDSLGGRAYIFTPTAGTPPANQAAINGNLVAQLGQIEAWITANPAGAVLTAGQTLFLAQAIAGLIRLAQGLLSTVGGS